MAINFPDSPSDGDLYTFDNKTWQYKNPPGAWNPVGTYVGITGPTGTGGVTGSTGPSSTITGPTGSNASADVVLVTSTAVTAVSSIAFTLDAAYSSYGVKFINVKGSTGNYIARVSQDGGSTYMSGGSDYTYCGFDFYNFDAIDRSFATGSGTSFYLVSRIGTTDNYPIDVDMVIFPGDSTRGARIKFFTISESASATVTTDMWVKCTNTVRITNIAFLAASGNFRAGGSIQLWGYK